MPRHFWHIPAKKEKFLYTFRQTAIIMWSDVLAVVGGVMRN